MLIPVATAQTAGWRRQRQRQLTGFQFGKTAYDDGVGPSGTAVERDAEAAESRNQNISVDTFFHVSGRKRDNLLSGSSLVRF